MPNLIVSTVGTSLLTNQASDDGRRQLYNSANIRESEMPADAVNIARTCFEKARTLLRSNDKKEIRQSSAELNGIYTFYEETQRTDRDIHWLISTDTYQGGLTQTLIADHLRSNGFNDIQSITPKGLSTANTSSFCGGIKDLLKQFDELGLSEYPSNGYHVVFNLVGGFKSLQGYLNTIGMFYADEIIYIFEDQNAQLIRIPRLPIQMDKRVIEQHAVTIALMAEGKITNRQDIGDIPEVFLDIDENGDCLLSEWGTLIWNKTKAEIMKERLLKFPMLEYSERFISDYSSWNSVSDKVRLQESLAKVSLILQQHQGNVVFLNHDHGLQYEEYQNGHGIGHFRISRELRVSAEVFGEGKGLRIRHFGRHDEVNNNP